MPTIAQISKAAFDGVSGAISGITFDATMAYDVQDMPTDYGWVVDDADETEDYGSVTVAATETEDYGLVTEDAGGYDTVTGEWSFTTTTYTGGRVIIGTQAAIASKFPAYVVGPQDTLMFLEGFTSVPNIGWRVTANGITRTMTAIGDISEGGTFFEVVAA